VHRAQYDALRRVTHVFVQHGTGTEMVTERTVYGEAAASPEATNLRGKAIARYDGVGVVLSDLFDFKGNLLASRRRLARAYHAQADWTALSALTDPAAIAAAAEALLETEVFASQIAYDALNRPTSLTTPDASEI